MPQITTSRSIEPLLAALGRPFYRFVTEAGRLAILFGQTLRHAFTPPLRLHNIFIQMLAVGVQSVPVALITASFTGGVLALQSYHAFRIFSAESLMGSLVGLSMTRELAPVLVGLVVAGRVGSAMAAELGTMRVTEQIDALVTLAVDPVKYLVVPRFLAGLLMLPLLTALADLVGIAGGYAVAVYVLGTNPVTYLQSTWDYVDFQDIWSGLVKAAFFGMVVAIVGCYKGFQTSGGAEGVGRSTTESVVLSMMLILISDYFITALFF